MEYYVDNLGGRCGNDGLSPETAVKDAGALDIKPGDRVLFCRGRTFFGRVPAAAGEEGKPVYYGAYGSGPKPRFSGAQALTGAWTRESGNIWKYEGTLFAEPGNVIFEEGAACGKLCFTPGEMSGQGDWYFPYAVKSGPLEDRSAALYMWSETDPAERYRKIECAVRVDHRLMGVKRNVILENLAFYGHAVHAFQTSNAVNISIINCDFDYIGGAVWSLKDRIRFGNAIEFWDGAENIEIRGCKFDNIYDSAATTQGRREFRAVNVVIADNVFSRYGMAACEVRDVMPERTVFSGNICEIGDGGFSSLFDGEVRGSEIYPEPMGHHLFFWRIDRPTPGGGIEITGNRFSATKMGAALYARISPEAAAQIRSDRNEFAQKGSLMIAMVNGKVLKSGKEYVEATGLDKNSRF
jgi:hypothetical protein